MDPLVYAESRQSREQAVSFVATHRNRILDYIEANLLEPDLSTAKIASACRISKRYIHMIFSDLDETVGRYILRRRLEASALALTSEDPSRRSITTIAYDCGFNSSTHFGRVFRRRFGVTPKQFRDFNQPRSGRRSHSNEHESVRSEERNC